MNLRKFKTRINSLFKRSFHAMGWELASFNRYTNFYKVNPMTANFRVGTGAARLFRSLK